MAVVVTHLQFSADTGGGTQNVAHGHGTTPEAALVSLSKAVSVETARDGVVFCIGFSDGTNDRGFAGKSESGGASSQTRTICRNSAVVIPNDSGAGLDAEAVVTFGATNVTLTWTGTPSVATNIQITLFSGLDGAKTVLMQPDGTTPAAVTHNLGLTTSNEALIFGITSTKVGGSWVTDTGDFGLSFGVAHWDGSSTFTERGFGFVEDNGEADGRPAGILETDAFFSSITSGYAFDYTASLSDFQTNDFDLTGSSASAIDEAVFLVLGLPSGTSANVGHLSAPTTLGSQEYSPLSYTPQYVGLLTTQLEALDSQRHNTDGDEAGAFGISSLVSGDGISCAVSIENDSATTDTQSVYSDEGVYMPSHDGTLAGSASAGNGCRATLTSLDSDGWTINTTGLSANSTQTYWLYWAIEGDAAPAGATVDVPLATYAIASNVPAVNTGTSVAVPLSTYSITASVPTIQTPVILSVPLSTYSISALVPSVEINVAITTPLSTYAISSNVPAVLTGASVIVPLETYAIAASIPAIETGVSVSAPLATYAITANIPVISTGVIVAVPLTTYAIAAGVPTISTGKSVSVPLSTYAIAASAPTIPTGASVAVPLSTYAIATNAPLIQFGQVNVPLATYVLSYSDFAPTLRVGLSSHAAWLRRLKIMQSNP